MAGGEGYRNESEVPTASNIEATPDSHGPLITSPDSARCEELPTLPLGVRSPHTHLLVPPKAIFGNKLSYPAFGGGL